MTTTPPRCGHRSMIGTHCYRPANHTGPHHAGFTDRTR